MQLPQADFTGQCNDNNFVLFEVNVYPPSSGLAGGTRGAGAPGGGGSCLREVATQDQDLFRTQCQSTNSVSRFVTSLLLAR